MKSSLKEINSRFYMPARVVMLPTNHEASLKGNELWINIAGKLKLSKPNSICPGPQSFQHLYIISDEKIEKGDWVYNPIYKTVYRWIENADVRFDKINAKKIIATTDESLYNEILPFEPMERIQYKYLPKPSKEFLEVYVKAYNEGKKIEEVLVEYFEHWETRSVGSSLLHEGNQLFVELRIKVNPDNTITIKKVKDSWSREEVIALYKANCERLTNAYISADIEWLEEHLY